MWYVIPTLSSWALAELLTLGCRRGKAKGEKLGGRGNQKPGLASSLADQRGEGCAGRPASRHGRMDTQERAGLACSRRDLTRDGCLWARGDPTEGGFVRSTRQGVSAPLDQTFLHQGALPFSCQPSTPLDPAGARKARKPVPAWGKEVNQRDLILSDHTPTDRLPHC